MHIARTRVLDPFRAAAWWILAAAVLGLARPAGAQSADETALFTPDELEELVAPIALYPDDLVAIVLPASTYPLDVVEAARLLDELEDDATLAPDEDWDDSIVALLNYPEVLRLMDEDLDWTWDLGEAFLNQQPEVFDAIQRFRAQAREAGNLESDERQIVTENEGAIRIAPADPKVIYVPYYEPRRVIVHHHMPVHYYPRPYPVYYYPYPAGYSFWSGYFWGVTTAFVIGWHSHFLHAHPYLHVGHPYYHFSYYEPFYVRRSVSINVVNVDRNVYVWQPRVHRIGQRPGRVTVTREGAVRADYGTRRYVSPGGESRRAVSTTSRASAAASSGRTIGRVAASEQRTATRTTRSTASSGRVTTREGIVSALRQAGDRSGNARSSVSRPSADSRSGAAQRSSRSSASIGGIATSRDTRRQSTSSTAGRATTARATTRRVTPSDSRLAPPTTRSNAASPTRSAMPSTRAAGSNRSAVSSGRSTARSSFGGVSSSRSTATRSRGNAVSPSRSAVSPSRSAVSPSRSAVSPSRSAVSPSRSAVSPSRSAVSPSRSAVSRSRSTVRSSRSTSRSTRSSSSRGTVRTSRSTSRSSRGSVSSRLATRVQTR